MQTDRLAEPLLCADDFGLTPGICRAVLSLGRKRKIGAASVMVQSPGIEDAAKSLASLRASIQIGLHFNLTEVLGDDVPYRLSKLVAGIRLSQTDQSEIARRLDSQLDLFETMFGMPPDYIDGHQHVQILPAIRRPFLSSLARRFGQGEKKPWIRQVAAPLTGTDAPLKSAGLSALNLGFRRQCARLGFPCNHVLFGVYSLAPNNRYQAMLTSWLEKAGAGDVIMCHPSDDRRPSDPIAEARLTEYLALENRP